MSKDWITSQSGSPILSGKSPLKRAICKSIDTDSKYTTVKKKEYHINPGPPLT